jgi:hypothetical protein
VILTIFKNDGLRQWGWDDIPYMKWKIIKKCLKPPTSHLFCPYSVGNQSAGHIDNVAALYPVFPTTCGGGIPHCIFHPALGNAVAGPNQSSDPKASLSAACTLQIGV